MFYHKIFKIITFCLFAFSQTLLSQIVLQGVVTDNGTEPFHNALVTITDQADVNRTFNSYTNEQGEYSIQISSTGVDDINSNNPGSFILWQNYPNPFNPSTIIGYELTKPAVISIKIYNVLGQEIRTLLDGFQAARSGQVIWEATDDFGQGVPAGLYIYSLRADGIRINKKMLLIDGQQGKVNVAPSHTSGTDASSQTVLSKQMSDQYLLQVTGDNIETYVQQNLEITDNMTLDITVIRTVTDIDGNVYHTVKIGDQWWLAENLKVRHYRNGDAIPNVTDDTEWTNLTTGAWCSYYNDSSYVVTYGRFYNWYTVEDSRNIAPAGWHVPTDEEWKELEMYLGMSQLSADSSGWRGTDEGSKLKTTSGWHSEGNGTNESGFCALPGGFRSDNGSYYNIYIYATFWSSTEKNSNNAWDRGLYHGNSRIDRYWFSKQSGYSVRLVRY